MKFKKKFFMANLVKSLAEVQQNKISLFLRIKGFKQIVKKLHKLRLTGALFSKPMLMLIEYVNISKVFVD
jgi:hypothetical protein